MSGRRFEFTDAKSRKFWCISRAGSSHTVQFGRIGTDGQTQTKEFATEAEAQRSSEKLIDEKLRKGYVEVTPGNGSTSASSASPAVRTAGPTAPIRSATAAQKTEQDTRVDDPDALAVHTPGDADSPDGGPKVSDTAAESRPVAELVPETLAITRTIRLDPSDWFRATWRPLTPLLRPEPAPFHRQEVMGRLLGIPTPAYGARKDWSKARISPSLSREEAHLWFTAMTVFPASTLEIATRIGREPFTGEISLEDARQAIGLALPAITPEIVLPLANLFSLAELFELMLNPDLFPRSKSLHHFTTGSPVAYLRLGFRDHVLPYLTGAEKELLRRLLLPMLDPSLWPTQGPATPPPQFYLAAVLGVHAPLLALVEGWQDDQFQQNGWMSYYDQQPLEILFGLGDPQLVDQHTRRLRLPLGTPEAIRAWLAHTEYQSLDWAAGSIVGAENRDQATALLEILALVDAPENAPMMLELMLQSKASRAARRWLEEHPHHAIAGLIPKAAGRGRIAEAAADWLRSLKRKGYEPLLRSRLTAEPAEVAERVQAVALDTPEEQFAPLDESSTPDWLRSLAADPAGLKRAKRPAWIDVADLPPVILGQRRLNEAQVEALLFALQSSSQAEADALLRAVKEKVDRPSLDQFLWRLFEQWLTDGAPSKENWAMKALGRLGSDAIALKLTPLIRQWPGESQHPRAVLGLECLRAIGTDAALTQINGIAQKIKFKGLKAKALECMEAIATERGFTRAELEDRIVPDCDLDERGSRVFDFGPRQFRMVLGPDLKPIIREESGKLRPDLPKPTGKDDAERAAAATAEWKLLKKQVAEIAKIQAVRLEQAMVTGRRWPRDAFETLLVPHPLMTTLVRRLVWGGYNSAGTLVATFRVTEDATCADVQDNTFDLAGAAQVGIVHPLHLTPEQRSTWGELLSDYEIVPPFPQLGRPIYRLEPGEDAKAEITRFAHVKIPAVSLVGTLERLDWARGIPEDGGCFHEHSKVFYGANVSAIIEYPGVPVGYMVDWDDQKIDRCYFISGSYRPEIYPKHPEPLPLGQIDPVVISEVLADLTTLASKGK